jgi:beta-glucosidase
MNKLKLLFLIVILTVSTSVNAKDNIIRILAIGNSFSEDAVEQNLHELAAADGHQTIIANMYIAGCSLERHLNNARNDKPDYRYRKIGTDGIRHQFNHMTLQKAITDEKWDYISLQQASGLSGCYDTYTPFLPALIAYVKSLAPKGCKIIWHQTWSYAKDSSHDAFKNYGRNQMQMYHSIMNCAQHAMNDNGITMVVPSGTAIQNARTTFIGDNMNRDGYHLNLNYGRYTAACTWYDAIFHKNVIGNSYIPNGMHKEIASACQHAAHAAVLKPLEVTNLSDIKADEILYKIPSLPIDIRINDLISRMTLKEKILQINQYTLGTNNIENNKGVEVKNIPAEIGSLIYFPTDPELRNRMQYHAMNDSRLGIPILFGYDCIHGFRTIFPIPLAQACSWNVPLAEQSCRVAAQECRMSGIDWTFSPMIDVSRDPRWGRVAESYGEDPFVNATFGAAAVRGYQGRNIADSISIAACLKHYVGYGASEAGRDYVYTEISRQSLWDTYLQPFEKCVQAGAATLMSSFNNISGIPSSANHYTLTEVLREKWGFRGLMVSDWGAVEQLINQNMAQDLKDAGQLALNAGVDMDMMSHAYDNYLEELVSEGKVSIATLDEAVRRTLRIKFQLGLFEHPYTPVSKSEDRFLRQKSIRTARQMAEESMVLLKNDSQLLPLNQGMKILVTGPIANATHDLLGCWWGHGEDSDIEKINESILKEFGAESEVRYLQGCDFDGTEESLFKQVEKLARWADVVVMCVGEKGAWSGENNSRADIGLPDVQRHLIQRVRAVAKKIVLILSSGRPMVISNEAAMADAVLAIWHPGLYGGSSVAGILSGRINPSGRLAMTFPYSQGQIPIYYGRRHSARPHQGFYKDQTSEALYPFGYGLSYTTFSYGTPTAELHEVKNGDKFDVTIPVTNTGQRDGMETVFWYVSDPYGKITRPAQELKHFEKKLIKKGETINFTFHVNVSRDFGYIDSEGKRFVESGDIMILVGDKKLKFTIK